MKGIKRRQRGEGVVLGRWDVSASQFLSFLHPSWELTLEQVLCYKPFLVWPICSQPYSTSYFHFITIHSFASSLSGLFCFYGLLKSQEGSCQFFCLFVCIFLFVCVRVFFTEVSPESEGGPSIQKSHNKYLLNGQERSWLFLLIIFHCRIQMNFDGGYQKAVESFSLKDL